jgi:hypothetical protein
MEFLENNYQNIILVLGAVYPPLLFLLPVKIASKIDIGIKVIKAVADTLEKAKNTKGGLSTTSSSEIENKTFIQKPKS